MDKISEISLGQKKLLLKNGTSITAFLIMLIVAVGFYSVKIQKFIEVDLIKENDRYYIMSRTDLREKEKIILQNGYLISGCVKKLSLYKYELINAQMEDSASRFIEKQYVSKGKISRGNINLFKGLLPF
jgi:hypothetical protein